jgi:hypothetical protein
VTPCLADVGPLSEGWPCPRLSSPPPRCCCSPWEAAAVRGLGPEQTTRHSVPISDLQPVTSHTVTEDENTSSRLPSCSKFRQNNARGTGFTSSFGLLTEAYFPCLKSAAEKNLFEDQVCKLPMDPEKFATFLTVILNCLLILFAWVTV